jgi:DNA-binding Lrp family transcriptional regulator
MSDGKRDNISDSVSPAAPQGRRHGAVATSFTDWDKRIIRVLQQDMPVTQRPFAVWSDQAGVAVADLLVAAASYQRRGLMRRFAAVLHHREVGFSANGMGVWAVPDQQQEQFGSIAAAFPEVSHCYLRPTYPEWPFSIFTMVHATSPAECQLVLARISQATGVKDYSALYSTHEYKKSRVQYFTSDIEAWERARSA